MAVVVLFFLSCNKNHHKQEKYVAYIGRYTDMNDATPQNQQTPNGFDVLHELALEKYLDEINVPNIRLSLKTFDCRKSGVLSDSIYHEIAKDTNIVAVIDNTWGEHLKYCANTIKSFNIPVIAINADRNNLDFGKNVIFTGNNDHVPLDEISFLKKALKKNKINFISERDYPIHETFLKEFEKNGIEVANQILINGRNFTKDDSMQMLSDIEDVFSNPQSHENYTIINTHGKIGTGILKFLDNNFTDLKLLGHSYIVDTDRIKSFGKGNHNDLILISTPTDAINKKLTLDVDELKLTNPENFKQINSSMFVKRCFEASKILESSLLANKTNKSITKHYIVDYFHSLEGEAINLKDDFYEFDSTLTMLPELYFVEYNAGKLSSCPLQLSMEREVIPNLFFGMEIVDIYNIDINTNSFTSDFYYWVKLDSTQKEAEKFIVFNNMKQNESSKELIIEKKKGSMIYKLYKVSGVFYVNFELQQYPFDRQEIFINAEILNPSNQVKVSFDEKTFAVDPSVIDNMKITEWEKEKFYVTVESTMSKGLHGDPDIAEEKLNRFKSIFYRLIVKRNPISPLLEIVLPLFLIGMVAISLLMIKDVSFENLGEVSIGVFITIVAFSISYSAATPNTDDLTRADLLFWTTFAVVLVVFLIVIITNSIYDKEEVVHIDLRKVGMLMGVIFTLLSAFYIFI